MSMAILLTLFLKFHSMPIKIPTSVLIKINKIIPNFHEIFKGPDIEVLSVGTPNILAQIILCNGSALCLIGGLAASLAFTHKMPVAFSKCSLG